MDRAGIYIIGEAGVNHNGSLERAIELIGVAKASGCDAVKFQTFKAANVASRFADRASYQQQNMPEVRESQREMLERLELSFDDFLELKKRADECGIDFMSKPSDIESVDFLEPLLEVYKISSGEVTNLPFIEYIARKNLPIIFSTGTADLAEVREAVDVIRAHQACRPSRFPPLTLLHCTTSYPCPPEDANLRAMQTLREAFDLPVGFSDHTEGIAIAMAAVALGAQILEKHFTLDRELPGPDHRASIEPDELSALVKGVRSVERALGDGVKRPMPSERPNVALVRKSVVAARDMRAGETFAGADLAIKRPGHGVPPKDLHKLIGRTALRDLQQDESVSWDDVGDSD